MLAHELRNPLAPIRNALEVLKLADLSPGLLRQTREMMERQVQVMARLVDDLLDVLRITRGKIELRKEPVELRTVVARAVETARPLIEARSHALTVGQPPEPLLVEGDVVRLAQVLANLLNNAAKYMRPGGRIVLTTARGRRSPGACAGRGHRHRAGGAAARVRPVHSGRRCGRAVAGRSRHRPDAGAATGGDARRQGGGGSAGLGRGSEFVVRLPALAETPRAAPEAAKGGENGEVMARRVLLVDDNADSADSLAELLRLWVTKFGRSMTPRRPWPRPGCFGRTWPCSTSECPT